VATPVGARCPTCAQVKRFALLVKPSELARATVFGVVVAALGTIALEFIPLSAFVALLGHALLGVLVGEAVSAGANRKRARELGPLAVACLVIGFEIGGVLALTLAGLPFGPEVLLQPLRGLLRSTLLLVGLLLGALLAWMRVR
jgi:hypothetical protein